MIHIGPYRFDGEPRYDSWVGFLYVGTPGLAEETPEGHLLEHDRESGRVSGITFVYPTVQLEREGAVSITLPTGERIHVPEAERIVRAAVG